MISIKTDKEIEVLREGGLILGGILNDVARKVKPGVTTLELETLACLLIKAANGRPSFKGYKPSRGSKPFPTALCTSINYEVVHAPAIPSRILKSGDIVGIDIGMEYKGLYTDTAVTVGVGVITNEAKKLLKVTNNSLHKSIEVIKPGAKLSDVSKAIQEHTEMNGYSVVRDFVGHGVGYAVHEDPQVPNFVNKQTRRDDIILKKGMVLAIEPMITAGSFEVDVLKDGFSVVTKDKSLAAQFEHTVAVVDGGVVIITAR
ncbi:type I methionyl aminopeptidase [Patescibacteria group bacterium]|nr:type I methionyl aminopeptidase [Patescibacteria group bacterium]